MGLHSQRAVIHRSMWGVLQAIYQVAGLAANVGIALVGGAVAGLLAKHINPARQTLEDEDLFEDAAFWEEVEPEKGHGPLLAE